MSDKISPNKISALSSTLLITLWAKAVEYDKANPLLKDREAVRMKKQIDYDFQKFESAHLSQVGCCGRAKLFDQESLKFLSQHQDAVVVQLGAGLDARFERLGKPQLSAWYDLDLPEVINIRRQLLPETSNHYLADSLFNTDWMKTVSQHNKPVLLILEGVLMFFPKEQVKQFIASVAENLPNSTMIFDIVPPMAVGRSKYHDALKKIDSQERPEFSWTIQEFKEIETWHAAIRLRSVHYISDVCRDRYPCWTRLLYATRWGKHNLDPRVVTISFVT
ncbi:methyltransferase [Pasteurella multocida]|nr:methyltransferase [Pasteurella multocida]